MHEGFNNLVKIATKNPNVAILMSGIGSNCVSILNNKHLYPNFRFKSIISDSKISNASEIAKKFKIDYKLFSWGSNLDRNKYFETMTKYLDFLEIDFLIFAGFMKIVPGFFTRRFLGINIHPADLTILDLRGKPILVGMSALEKSLNYGYICSTVHLVEEELDCGMPIAVSEHIKLETIKYTKTDLEILHSKLKNEQEHWLFPSILGLLSSGEIYNYNLPIDCERIHLKRKFNAYK